MLTRKHISTSRCHSSSNEVEVKLETSRPSVLLVDDNEFNLQLLCAYTKKDNYQYMAAKNGAEAVDIYKAHPGKFRVIIIGMFKF
jgi:CheY-like chemotaxis protein